MEDKTLEEELEKTTLGRLNKFQKAWDIFIMEMIKSLKIIFKII